MLILRINWGLLWIKVGFLLFERYFSILRLNFFEILTHFQKIGPLFFEDHGAFFKIKVNFSWSAKFFDRDFFFFANSLKFSHLFRKIATTTHPHNDQNFFLLIATPYFYFFAHFILFTQKPHKKSKPKSLFIIKDQGNFLSSPHSLLTKNKRKIKTPSNNETTLPPPFTP